MGFCHAPSGWEQPEVPPGFLDGLSSKSDAVRSQEVSQPCKLRTQLDHPHVNVCCDGCNNPIVGVRYQCLSRENYDLCEGCVGSVATPGETWMRQEFLSCQSPAEAEANIKASTEPQSYTGEACASDDSK